ncbi:G12 [Culex quinquefasciatus]|uniref:G12 n=1 Tax=Culex quinquefasciatus TaxID=7176 RepID=B0X1R6_CULQU|nr:protein G12 [Culex quinquefasciatus]EDS38794.1 G12 [Culex quinquefasciatus]|eukprot:XP_001863588.1 G12 [Culex quinquefasciatus]
MKIFIAFAALVAFASASAIPETRGLKEDLKDFLALVPVDKLTSLALDYYANDKEVQAAFAYLQDKEFAAIWDQLFALKEIKDLLNYLQDAGLDVYHALNVVADLLGLSHVKPIRREGLMKTGGLSGFLEEALALLPKDQIKALFEEKLKTSPEFKALFEKLQHADFHKLVEFYNNSKEVQSLFQKLREHGIDVDKFVELVASFFGWGKFW